jgi:hypothetical protein
MLAKLISHVPVLISCIPVLTLPVLTDGSRYVRISSFPCVAQPVPGVSILVPERVGPLVGRVQIHETVARGHYLCHHVRSCDSDGFYQSQKR